jgi:hypothetical protein
MSLRHIAHPLERELSVCTTAKAGSLSLDMEDHQRLKKHMETDALVLRDTYP